MTERLVIDSCVAIKWFVTEADSWLADGLVSPDIQTLVPDFALVEIANALWKSERLGRIEEKEVVRAIASLPHVFDEILPSVDVLADAFDLARRLDHPVYDCLYVAAANRAGARLVTTNQKLLAKLKATKDRTAADLAKWKP